MTEAVKERQQFIGGSEAAAVLGLSRWSTPLQVWAHKTGEVQREEDKGELYKTLGSRLEEVVAELFTAETGKAVRRVNRTLFHRDYPFLGGNIDREVLGEDAGLECKTASAWKAKEWAGEEIPQEYIIQCHHYLAVTGKKRWYLAVLIGNQDFQVKTIERDEKLLKNLVEQEVKFWREYVEEKVMPANLIKAEDSDTLYQLFPVAEPVTVNLGDQAAALIEQRNALIQDNKQVESQLEKVENELKAMLGTNEAGTAGKYLVRWQNGSQVRLDTDRIKQEQPELYKTFGKESKFRRFTIKEVKNGNR